MPATRSSSRDLAIEKAAELFSSQGYAATGVAEVIEESGTPKGSFYFNFPGGKEELGIEALRRSGANLEAGLNLLADRATSRKGFLKSLIEAMSIGLETSDYAQGCPIATVALETATRSGPIREAAGEQFAAWEEAIAQGVSTGSKVTKADRRMAGTVLMLLEGALLMSKVRRSTEPVRSLDRTFDQLSG